MSLIYHQSFATAKYVKSLLLAKRVTESCFLNEKKGAEMSGICQVKYLKVTLGSERGKMLILRCI